MLRHSEQIGKVMEKARELMPNLPYHNFGHAVDVYSAIVRYASEEYIDSESLFVLKSVALLHDIDKSEEKSSEFAQIYLPTIGYTENQAKRVGRLILPTKLPQTPKDYLEMLLCDADLDNLGREDFFELGEKVREELGLPSGIKWYQQQLQFLKSHNYHTGVARKLRNNGKQTNIQKLEKMLGGGKC